MVFPLDSLFALIYTRDIDLIKVPMNLVVGWMQISIICMTIPLRGPAHYWGPSTFHDLALMIPVHLLAKCFLDSPFNILQVSYSCCVLVIF